jgi:hypothetical protein
VARRKYTKKQLREMSRKSTLFWANNPAKRRLLGRKVAAWWRANPQPRQREHNPNARMSRRNAEFVLEYRSRATTQEIAAATGEPIHRVLSVLRRVTWVGLRQKPLPPLSFPNEIDGLAVLSALDGAYAVRSDGAVFSFPLAADRRHHVYSLPRRVKALPSGKVRVTYRGIHHVLWQPNDGAAGRTRRPLSHGRPSSRDQTV